MNRLESIQERFLRFTLRGLGWSDPIVLPPYNSAVEKVQFEDSVMPTLTDELCKAFPNMKELRLNKVSMKDITPNAFHECKQLTIVSFWTTKLEKLDQNLFENNPALDKIHFQKTNLKSIDGKMFEPVKQLRELALSESFMTEFPIDQFPQLVKLEILYLYENDLTDLDEEEVLRKFPNLKKIYIHNNQFDCGRLRITLSALRRNNIEVLEWSKDEMKRNTNLTTIEKVECVPSLISDLLIQDLAGLEEKIYYMIIAIGILLGLFVVIPVVWFAIWKIKNCLVTKVDQPVYDYYEDAGRAGTVRTGARN